MTHLVDLPTKKSLREALKAGRAVNFRDPSIFNPKDYMSTTMPNGTVIYCTNPKRSWFAEVVNDAGTVKVRG